MIKYYEWGQSVSPESVSVSYFFHLKIHFPANIQSAHCILHLLDLIVNDAVLNQSAVKTLVTTCAAIVKYLHQSSKGTEAFIKKQMESKGIYPTG